MWAAVFFFHGRHREFDKMFNGGHCRHLEHSMEIFAVPAGHCCSKYFQASASSSPSCPISFLTGTGQVTFSLLQPHSLVVLYAVCYLDWASIVFSSYFSSSPEVCDVEWGRCWSGLEMPPISYHLISGFQWGLLVTWERRLH